MLRGVDRFFDAHPILLCVVLFGTELTIMNAGIASSLALALGLVPLAYVLHFVVR
jgi:hypothetical protein